MTGSLLTDVSALIVALATLLAASSAAWQARRVHHEVRTLNEMTIGQLGEAAETRRVDEIPPADRTDREARHVAAQPPEEP